METAPKSLRVQIGIFGRVNVGKSSLLNMIAGQDVAITSSVPGTTTDVVEKTMELLPLGPVVFLDTAGLDDASILGEKRLERTRRALERSDMVVLVTEAGVWGEFEEGLLQSLAGAKPVLIIVNKIDAHLPDEDFLARLRLVASQVLPVSALDRAHQEEQVVSVKQALAALCPEGLLQTPSLIGDLLPPGGLAVLVVPIDLQAPKGRLILPQVQTIRDALDNDAATLVVKEREYLSVLQNLKRPPDLVVCDSQVVMKMVADTDSQVKCTTFSILFARFKGELTELARGAAHIEGLKPGDKVLIAESCSHHAAEDDIGRVKIPRWLRQYVGGDLKVTVFSGRDYPSDLKEYKLVIHCGSCMLTRGEMLLRIKKAKDAGVPITNYGVAISLVQGVLPRVLAPFPSAISAYEREVEKIKEE